VRLYIENADSLNIQVGWEEYSFSGGFHSITAKNKNINLLPLRNAQPNYSQGKNLIRQHLLKVARANSGR